MSFRYIVLFPIGALMAFASCLSPAGPSGGAVIPAPFAASAGPTPENSDDRGASDPSATSPPPGATVSDSPITVVGTPMGSSPIPDCLPSSTKLFFDDALTAITGKTDDLGRNEILVKTAVHLQLPNEPPGISGNLVSFGSPDTPYQYYGSTAPWDGCVFAKIYAPPGAVGKIVRLSTSVLVCPPDTTAVAATPGEASVAALTLGWTPLEAFLDVPIPAETAQTSLDDCGAWNVGDHLRDEALHEEMIQKRIEKHQEDGANPSETSNPWKASILRPKF